MKFTSKSQYYESPRQNQGVFPNAYIETTSPEKKVVDGVTYLHVNFDLKYLKAGVPVLIESFKEVFAERQPATILNELDEEVELIPFLENGGTYNKERIVKRGRASAYDLEHIYFKPETIWSENIEITDDPILSPVVLESIYDCVLIQGVELGVNFELEEETL